MSVIDKKLLLEELGKRVGEIVPSGETGRILAAAGEILERFNVEAFESPVEADASEGLIRLFLDAKASEGRSDKTLDRYGYVLRRLHETIGTPLDRVTVYHLRSYISSEMDRGISASTMEGSRSIWCGFFGWLKAWLASRTDDSPALFTGKGSPRMTPDGVRRALNTIAERAGVENVHPHRFRRTLATQLIDRGMSLQEVAAILGHSKLDTTMTYVYVDRKKVEQSYRRYA